MCVRVARVWTGRPLHRQPLAQISSEMRCQRGHGAPPSPAKVPLDAPDGALEHGPDLARLQVGEPLPAQLAALLVPGAIESDQVQVRVDGAPSPEGAAEPSSSALAYGSGLRSSRRSDEVLCTTVTAPVFAPRAPSRAARSA